MVGVRDETGVDLGHARKQALLVVGKGGPGSDKVELRPRLALGSSDAGRLAVRVDRRELEGSRGWRHRQRCSLGLRGQRAGSLSAHGMSSVPLGRGLDLPIELVAFGLDRRGECPSQATVVSRGCVPSSYETSAARTRSGVSGNSVTRAPHAA